MAPIKIVDATSVQRNTRNSNSRSLPARELFERNCKKSTVSKDVKRKPTRSPQKDESKENVTLKTTISNEDCISLNGLTMDIPHNRPRRHTDVCLESKKAPKPYIKQKTKNTSITKTKLKLPKLRTNNCTSLRSNSMSSSASEMSQLSIDSLTTSRSENKSNKKQLKSVPAVIKRKSAIAGLRTPIPKKGTLKRHRWLFNTLKKKNEGYEDDIFENQKFQTPAFRLLNGVADESDSSIPTPKFGFVLSPAVSKKTPTSKKTISSPDLLLARKNAEEYLYRRNRKRTTSQSMLNSSPKSKTSAACDEMPEKKKLEFTEAMEKIRTVCKDIEKKIEDETEEDNYFTD